MKEVKRGYVKWRDEDGKLHKVKEEDYNEPAKEVPFGYLPEPEDN
tara:strand:+ start:349 stop:483 length:135 start_codon:yes stop_codon:yes gene_type:complete